MLKNNKNDNMNKNFLWMKQHCEKREGLRKAIGDRKNAKVSNLQTFYSKKQRHNIVAMQRVHFIPSFPNCETCVQRTRSSLP